MAEIREAYDLIGGIVGKAQAEGVFKAEIDARFAAMAFYGAIEQLLTGWIFGLLPQGERALRARQVAGRGDGLRRPADAHGRAAERRAERLTRAPARRAWARRPRVNRLPAVENEMVKRLMWSALLAGLGALASIVAHRAAAVVVAARVRRGAARVSAPPRRPRATGRTPARTSHRRTSPPRSRRSPSARRCSCAKRSSWPRRRSPKRRPSSSGERSSASPPACSS